MRKGDDVHFLYTKTKKGNTFLGISTGTDTCTEHECGIRELREIFGVPLTLTNDSIGIKNHAATRGASKDFFTFAEGKGYIFLGVQEAPYFWDENTPIEKKVPHDLQGFETRDWLMRDGVCAAWDEGGFFIIAKEQHRKPMELLRDAILAGNIAFLNLGRWNKLPKTSGLSIVLTSELPKYVNQELEREHKEMLRAKNAFDESGVEARLKAAGKMWFALSRPRFTEKGELVAWLNPIEQNQNNFGWFTVADFDAWIRGEGPIPMKNISRQGR